MSEARAKTGKMTIEVGGVWVRRQFEHLGGALEVNGEWRLLERWSEKTGHISHIFEAAGIAGKPRDPLYDWDESRARRDPEATEYREVRAAATP